ncbi:MAG: DUF3817 domain-containing protein, partial [Bdellovibrionia bacterium]
YFAGLPEAVRLAGTLHGILFIMYIYTSITLSKRLKWTFPKLVSSWAIASIPLGPVIFEKRLFSKA